MPHERALLVAVFAIIVCALGAMLLPAAIRYDNKLKRINVEETCEQLHAFVHNGRKYYCAPWIEADEDTEIAPAAQETTHA